jgi:hypothetical protein
METNFVVLMKPPPKVVLLCDTLYGENADFVKYSRAKRSGRPVLPPALAQIRTSY